MNARWADLRARSVVHVLRCRDAERTATALMESHDRNSSVRGLIIRLPLLPAELLAEWCGVGRNADDAVAAALLARVRALLNVSDAAESIPERHWRAESAGDLVPHSYAVQAARRFISDESIDRQSGVRRGLHRLLEQGLSDAEQFECVSRLWGLEDRPMAIVARDQIEPSFVMMLRRMVQAVERAPDARVVLVVEPSAWESLAGSLDSHTLAVLQEGLIDQCVESPSPAPPAAAPAGPDTIAPMDRTLRELREKAQTAVRQAIGAAPAPVTAAAKAQESAARSLAEALLFAALQADPRTTDLFALNADGGFWFGPRRAEIDLFCRWLSIAIEVDGYFHFQDKEAYRRDRAKDWRMQRHGLLVLRFLAEDVTEHLPAVMRDIADAVALRRRQQGKPQSERS